MQRNNKIVNVLKKDVFESEAKSFQAFRENGVFGLPISE